MITPPGFKEAYTQFVEGGWSGLSLPEKWGGQGLPQSLSILTSEIVATANWTWAMFPGLSRGAINTVLAHGSEDLKAKYLPKLVSGEWTGTMCLTEPQCGSDLAQVRTKAVPSADGSTYKVRQSSRSLSLEMDLVYMQPPLQLPNPHLSFYVYLFFVPKYPLTE